MKFGTDSAVQFLRWRYSLSLGKSEAWWVRTEEQWWKYKVTAEECSHISYLQQRRSPSPSWMLFWWHCEKTHDPNGSTVCSQHLAYLRGPQILIWRGGKSFPSKTNLNTRGQIFDLMQPRVSTGYGQESQEGNCDSTTEVPSTTHIKNRHSFHHTKAAAVLTFLSAIPCKQPQMQN